MTEELKPCPFCGGSDIGESHRHNRNNVRCNSCGATLPQSDIGYGDAGKLWNRRSHPVASEPSSGERALFDAGEIGHIFEEHRHSNGIKLLALLVESVCIIDKTACWDHMVMFDLRDEIERLLDVESAALLSSDAKPASEQEGFISVEAVNASEAKFLRQLLEDLEDGQYENATGRIRAVLQSAKAKN